MEKIVSQLDDQRFFIGPVVADSSPLKKGEFLIPGGAVDVEPPKVPSGMRARWNGTSFDFEPVPVQPKPNEPSLDVLRAAKNEEINVARSMANGSTFRHDGTDFSCDTLSRSDIDGVNGYVALYEALPPSFPGAWKAEDNSYYPIANVTAWKSFYASMVATGSANFQHAQQLKARLATAATIEDVVEIVW